MNMQGAINKEFVRCDTPSTDETNCDIIESLCQLPQLLQLIFVENYTYCELQSYFKYSFEQMDQCPSFVECVNRSVKVYMDKILQHIKDTLITKPFDVKHLKDYVTIIKEIHNTYKVTQLKHQQLQQVVKSYYIKENVEQSIHCARLIKHTFINVVLKEPQINTFLQSMQQLLDKKFYSYTQKYSNVKEKLKFLIQLTTLVQRELVTKTRPWAIEKIEQPIKEPKKMEQIVQINNTTKLNEYKKFEQRLEEHFQKCVDKEKIEIKVSEEWLNSLKSKIKRK